MAEKIKEKFLTIHGHFYQPPRENPWLEAMNCKTVHLLFTIGMREFAKNVIIRILYLELLITEIEFLI